LKIAVDFESLLARLGVVFSQASRADGDFLLQLGHRPVLLGLPVGSFAGDLGLAVIAAVDRQDRDQR
jgi:hypothetical protein